MRAGTWDGREPASGCMGAVPSPSHPTPLSLLWVWGRPTPPCPLHTRSPAGAIGTICCLVRAQGFAPPGPGTSPSTVTMGCALWPCDGSLVRLLALNALALGCLVAELLPALCWAQHYEPNWARELDHHGPLPWASE